MAKMQTSNDVSEQAIPLNIEEGIMRTAHESDGDACSSEDVSDDSMHNVTKMGEVLIPCACAFCCCILILVGGLGVPAFVGHKNTVCDLVPASLGEDLMNSSVTVKTFVSGWYTQDSDVVDTESGLRRGLWRSAGLTGRFGYLPDGWNEPGVVAETPWFRMRNWYTLKRCDGRGAQYQVIQDWSSYFGFGAGGGYTIYRDDNVVAVLGKSQLSVPDTSDPLAYLHEIGWNWFSWQQHTWEVVNLAPAVLPTYVVSFMSGPLHTVMQARWDFFYYFCIYMVCMTCDVCLRVSRK